MTQRPDFLKLTDFEVDPIRGFLPAQNPVQELPRDYGAWEQIAADLSSLLTANQLRPAIDRLSVLETSKLVTQGQLQRAMLLLSMFGNAYVCGGGKPATVIPRGLSVPWSEIAERVGRPMITSHASIVLNNWRLLDETGEIDLDNIGALQLFLGGMDEAWFYLVTVAIEARGAAALPCLVDLQNAVVADVPEQCVAALLSIASAVQRIMETLLRMPERCAPYVFYHRVRPFLAGWGDHGIIYEGVYEEPLVLAGGSAAQSSLLQAIDAGLSIAHEDERTRPFLMEMRNYMPPPHRRFIEALEAGPSVHRYVADQAFGNPALQKCYNECIELLCEFRKKHLEITIRYIKQQAAADDQVIGTGGTDFVPFLKESRNESRDRLIGKSVRDRSDR